MAHQRFRCLDRSRRRKRRAGTTERNTDESERIAASCSSPHERIAAFRSEEHTSELQSPCNLVCRLLLEKNKNSSDAPSPPFLQQLGMTDALLVLISSMSRTARAGIHAIEMLHDCFTHAASCTAARGAV